ncbi:unnamed protein product [Clavelina lepadiformis]|uniref:dual-specificity kinase n=1 Tax=Clavelina lepadiformis TaxID=159417 RepID=A0ABP0F1M2_CLALP
MRLTKTTCTVSNVWMLHFVLIEVKTDVMSSIVVFLAGFLVCLIVQGICKAKCKQRYAYAMLFTVTIGLLYYYMPECGHGLRVEKQSFLKETLLTDKTRVHDVIQPVMLKFLGSVSSFPVPAMHDIDNKDKNSNQQKEIYAGEKQHNASKIIDYVAETNPHDSAKSPTIQDSEERNAEKQQNHAKIFKHVNFFEKFGTEDDLQSYVFAHENPKNFLSSLKTKEVEQEIQHYLSWWETLELPNYPQIWYFGRKANKTVYNQSDPLNYGFDYMKEGDRESRLRIVKGDHIAFRYEIIRKLGSGSFGTVVRALDHALPADNENLEVAIKILHNDSSAKEYFKQEIDMMRLVKQSTRNPERFPNILKTFYFRNHFCIVYELLGKTLDDVHNEPVHDMDTLRKYTKDILLGVVDLHKSHIIHGDLKPDNLMLAPNCNASCDVYVKVADFNLACIQNSTDYTCPGRYFQTRFYRAPEVILDIPYDETADMWSVGVIVAELFLHKVPFYGESSTDQLAAIMEVIGLVPTHMIEQSPRIHTYQRKFAVASS